MKASSEINWVQVPCWAEDHRFICFEIYDPSHHKLWKEVPLNKIMEAYDTREWTYQPKLRVVYNEDLQNSALPIYGTSLQLPAKKVTPDFIAEFHNDIDKLRRKHARRQENRNAFMDSYREALNERRRKDLVIGLSALAMIIVIIAAIMFYLTHRGI